MGTDSGSRSGSGSSKAAESEVRERLAAAAGGGGGGGGGGVLGVEDDMSGLPIFARDLVNIVKDKVRVQYATPRL
jgi:hypothetical protein